MNSQTTSREAMSTLSARMELATRKYMAIANLLGIQPLGESGKFLPEQLSQMDEASKALEPQITAAMNANSPTE